MRGAGARTLLRGAKQRAVLLQAKVHLQQVRAREQLDDHAGRDDGRNTKLHERTAVRREDHTHPEQRIGAVTRHDTIQRNLRRHQEYGQHNGGPHHAGLERHCWGEQHDAGVPLRTLALRRRHLWQHREERPYQRQKTNCSASATLHNAAHTTYTHSSCVEVGWVASVRRRRRCTSQDAGVVISQPTPSFFQPVVCDVPRRETRRGVMVRGAGTRQELTPTDHPSALFYVWQGDR